MNTFAEIKINKRVTNDIVRTYCTRLYMYICNHIGCTIITSFKQMKEASKTHPQLLNSST